MTDVPIGFHSYLDGLQHGISIQISINLGEKFLPISCITKIIYCCDLNLDKSLWIFTLFLFQDSGLKNSVTLKPSNRVLHVHAIWQTTCQKTVKLFSFKVFIGLFKIHLECRHILWEQDYCNLYIRKSEVCSNYTCSPAQVVWNADNAIHQVNHYPADSLGCFC